MKHEINGMHLISGQWSPAAGPQFKAVNPGNGQEMDPAYTDAGQEQVDVAAIAAVEAFEQVAHLPPHWPADLLDAIAARIMDLGDALLERTEQETALPRVRLVGERTRTTNQLKMFAEIVREGSWVEATIDTADPTRAPLPKPDLRRMLRPRGPVVVFGASNFPYAFGAVGGDTASALAGGNPGLVKGHPSHPGTSELLAAAVLEAITQLRLPVGLFALLQGRSHGLSGTLVQHPDITAVGFTGSLRAGRALFDLAAARENPIPVYAEMGSVNPVFILPGAMAQRSEKIAQDLSASVLLGGGQFCTKPGLIFTIGDDTSFMQQLAERITQQPPITMLNQNLRESFHARISEFEHVPGVRAIARGQPSGHASVSPSLFETDLQTWQRQPRLHEEAFGPGALIIHCRSIDDALAGINSLEGSLTGTVHLEAPDEPAAQLILRRLEGKVGRVVVNGYPTGVEVCNAIVHGGPYPATTDPGSTSVGHAALRRFARMVAYQDTPQNLLPPALRDDNPLKIQRVINGQRSDRTIG
jgi:2,5-dioxopentanoate dehydrogenase